MDDHQPPRVRSNRHTNPADPTGPSPIMAGYGVTDDVVLDRLVRAQTSGEILSQTKITKRQSTVGRKHELRGNWAPDVPDFFQEKLEMGDRGALKVWPYCLRSGQDAMLKAKLERHRQKELENYQIPAKSMPI